MSCSVFVCHPSHCGNDLKWLSHVIGTLPSFGALMKLLSFLLACYGNPHKGSEHFRIVSRYAVVAVVNRSVDYSARGRVGHGGPCGNQVFAAHLTTAPPSSRARRPVPPPGSGNMIL